MAKIVKQTYINKNGEKKTYSYLVAIPKSVVEASEINEDDEITAYVDYGMIVINKKYHCTCMECDYEWDTGISYKDYSACPRCHCGDIKYEINGE